MDYFLSFINYKIATCYELFFDFKSYYYNAGFYIAVGTLVLCLCGMGVFLTGGIKSMNKQILENTPNKKKLIDAYREQLEKRKNMQNIQFGTNNPAPKKQRIKNLNKELDSDEKLKNKKMENNLKSKIENNNKKNNKIKNERINNKGKKNTMLIRNRKKSDTLNELLTIRRQDQKKFKTNIIRKTIKNESIVIKNIKKKPTIKPKSSKRFSLIDIDYKRKGEKKKTKRKKMIKDEYGLKSYVVDEQVDKKEYNTIPFEQALRIDNRSCLEIFLSVFAHEIEIVDIFYYRNPFSHLSIVLSIYLFELCLDLTLNCLLYTDDVVSEKYNNNGSIGFMTSLSLSFMSNIFAGIIAFVVGKLAEYGEILELIMKDITKKKEYLLNIIKFKKYLTLKMTGFFIIQFIINLGMCYYLMIFCTVYHNTQGSILVNYIIGIAESLAISFGLTIITSMIRFLSIKNKWRNIYYTSKYFFENF